jgi:phosphatidylethanolamine/phosphatidyl-N-methylethanolamine N-methyltransferase
MLKNVSIFVREFINSFQTTGSVCPTSKWSAMKLVGPLENRKSEEPLKILELGPGTGSVTKWILRKMDFGDKLTICEINPRFMQSLQDNLEKDQYFLTHKNSINFHCCPMQELPEDEKFDVIICAIPFLTLTEPLLKDIFLKIMHLSHQQTVLTYYEYRAMRRLGRNLSPKGTRDRMGKLCPKLEAIINNHALNKELVFSNFPPLTVYTLSGLDRLEHTLA